MNPGHYIYKALDDIAACRDAWLTKLPQRTLDGVQRVLHEASKAPKYLLPDRGDLLHPANPLEILGDLIRESPALASPPHPLQVLEYTCEALSNTTPRKRFAVVWTPEGAAFADGTTRDDVIFTAIEFWQIPNGPWVFDRFGVVATSAHVDRGVGVRTAVLDGSPEGAEEADDAIKNGNLLALGAAASLIGALACRNVEARALDDPSRLNKVRETRGKPPFTRYHILTIKQPSMPMCEEGRGSHGSPAFHVRRGHIRRLAKGSRTWVSQCTVGSPSIGVVTKDYRVQL